VRADEEIMVSNMAKTGSLDERPVPDLLPEQVRRFTTGSLRAKPVRQFDPITMLSNIRSCEGKKVLAIDIGGDKLAISHFTVREGAVQAVGDTQERRGNGGAGYLAAMLEVTDLAHRGLMPVGISFAGPTVGTRLIDGPNLPVFVAEFNARYDNDFANIFPAVEVANDAEAGMMCAALEAVRRYPGIKHVIYIINGSGLGGSVLTGNRIFATEPGHVEIAEQLNTFTQQKSCGLLGAMHVCIEAVAASKAGIEDIWLQQTGEPLTGIQIAARYLSGDEIAADLYDNSALVMAHAIKGLAEAFDLLDDSSQFVIVGHGGIFHVPGYGDRLRGILTQDLAHAPRILFTKDFGANACLDGAAIAAVGRLT
jgi:predicted NBD/HSP70 family sugar kinase